MIRAEQIILPTSVPDEVVEAAAKALYETWCAVNEVADTSLPWDDIYDGERNACIAEARAAIAAALNVWPGAEVAAWYHADQTLILPLPDEASDE